MKNYTNIMKAQKSLSNNEKLIEQGVNKYFNRIEKFNNENNSLESTYKIKKDYYKVLVKCGHVRANNYTLVDFAVVAKNGVEAAEKAKRIPRAKHDHSDVIRKVTKITEEEFNDLIERNRCNPYLTAQCVQDQRKYAMDCITIYPEEYSLVDVNDRCWDKKYDRKDKIDYLKRREKILKNSWKEDSRY